MESAPDALVIANREGNIVFVNAQAEAMFGYSRQELLNQPVEILVPERLRSAHAKHRVGFVSNPARRPMGAGKELLGRRKDGSEIPVEVALSPLGEGEDLLVSAAIRDISERRKADEFLRSSEERFRLLAKATSDAIWDWNLTTNEMWWSEGFRTLFGMRDDEIKPTFEWWFGRVHPDDKNAAMAAVYRAIEARAESWSGEYRFLRDDGRYAYVLDREYVIRDSNQKAVRLIGSITDITERRRFEERLAEQAALLDAAHEAIYVKDMEDRIIYWNKGAERTFGWSSMEALGKNAVELLHGDTRPAYLRAAASLMESGQWQGELTLRGKHGHPLAVAVSWTLVRDARERPKAVLVIGSDITERKKIDEHLLRSQRMESIGTLAGGIAHDINNVLSPIVMSIDLLKEEEQQSERLRLISVIESSASRGSDLVKQLLAYARGMDSKRADVNLVHTAREIRRVVRQTFPPNISFNLERPGDLWQVHGDPTQLYQLLMNLCINARDAMPNGGALVLRLQNTVLDKGSDGMDPEAKAGSYVLLLVEDSGMGIPKEIHHRIFDPFFTTKEAGKGTGLGLSTSLAIVKNHGGFLDFSSEPGKGTQFRVYIPASESRVRTAVLSKDITTREALPPRGRGELILVADDEENIRAMTKETLEHRGYRVLLAANGAEAAELYSKHGQDISAMLVDAVMPVMDGIAAVKAIYLREFRRRLCFVDEVGIGIIGVFHASV